MSETHPLSMAARLRVGPVIILLIALLTAACNADTPGQPAAAPVAPPPAAAPDSAAGEAHAEEENLDTGDAAGTDAPDAAAGETRVFRIAPDQSEASYAVDEEFFNRAVRFVTAVGRTNTIEGELTLTIQGDRIAVGDNRFVVDLRTLTSDSGQRDRRIRNEWLQSNTYPWAEFVATEVRNFPPDAREGQDLQFELVGEMTIREITQPMVFETTARLDGDTLVATAQGFLYMRDFGFEPPSILGVLTVTDGVTVNVELTAVAD